MVLGGTGMVLGGATGMVLEGRPGWERTRGAHACVHPVEQPLCCDDVDTMSTVALPADMAVLIPRTSCCSQISRDQMARCDWPIKYAGGQPQQTMRNLGLSVRMRKYIQQVEYPD